MVRPTWFRNDIRGGLSSHQVMRPLSHCARGDELHFLECYPSVDVVTETTEEVVHKILNHHSKTTIDWCLGVLTYKTKLCWSCPLNRTPLSPRSLRLSPCSYYDLRVLVCRRQWVVIGVAPSALSGLIVTYFGFTLLGLRSVVIGRIIQWSVRPISKK